MGFDPQCQGQHLFQGCGNQRQKAKSRRLSLKSETQVLIKDLRHEAHTYLLSQGSSGGRQSCKRRCSAGQEQGSVRGSGTWAGSRASLPRSFAHSVTFLLPSMALVSFVTGQIMDLLCLSLLASQCSRDRVESPMSG